MLIIKIIGIIVIALLALYLIANIISLIVGAVVFTFVRREQKRIRRRLW